MYGEYYVKYKRNTDNMIFEEYIYADNALIALLQLIGSYTYLDEIS